jgi:hypothetical protein
MIRTSLFSLALFALIGTSAIHGDEAKAKRPSVEEAKEGFRVYTVSLRCQSRQLQSVHLSVIEAFRAADELREKGSRVEVTTGSEGKKLPVGSPELYVVYLRPCKVAWEKREVVCDAKKAEQVAKQHKDNGDTVQVVHDYAPKEVFHVYGGGCSRSYQLRGTYTSAEEAFRAAESFRADKKWRCNVASGTKGKEWLTGSPAQYVVYERACKNNWTVGITTKDLKKAEEAAAAGEWGKGEVVHQYASK